MALIHNLLSKIGLNENEVETLISINPDLKNTDPEIIFSNLVAVSSAGFPDDELNWLCLNNARFLSYETKKLQDKIFIIKSKHSDFEKTLKENPSLL